MVISAQPFAVSRPFVSANPQPSIVSTSHHKSASVSIQGWGSVDSDTGGGGRGGGGGCGVVLDGLWGGGYINTSLQCVC